MNNTKYLEEAIRIGDEILEKVERTDEGYTWKTMTSLGGNMIDWQVSESLYSGTAGIVYFLLELHKRTNDERYLEAALQGVKWLENYCANNPTDYYAFYTGRMGVAYLMLIFADYCKDDSYKVKALKIAEGCEAFLYAEKQIDDLINGSSGTLLGLLHLHAATGDVRVMSYIKKYTDHLIARINITDNGFYWDRSGTSITGLCGFSHGAAGIGYVFLELGRYFKNDTFYWIAEKAFSYENHCFNKTTNNWPDFRRGFYDQKSLDESRERYINGDKQHFLTPGDMSAWCHGAPGIGLSRIRAYEILKKDQYLTDLNNAITKTKEATLQQEKAVDAAVLCHGGGGNAILFLEASRVLSDTGCSEWAREAADKALKYWQKTGRYLSGYSYAGPESDLSLFMGNAGIGYFYLLISDERQLEPTILKPDLNTIYRGNPEGVLAIKPEELFGRLAFGLYPLTYDLVKDDLHLASLANAKNDSFITSIKKLIEAAVNAKNDPKIKSIWAYEIKKEELDSAVESHSYNRIRRVVEIERNENILKDESELLNTVVVLPKEHQLYELPQEVVNKNEEDGDYVIFIPTPEVLLEFPLNDFAYTVVQKFENPKRVKEVMAEMVNEFEVSEESEIDQVRMVTLNQIKEALSQGILFTSSSQVVAH